MQSNVKQVVKHHTTNKWCVKCLQQQSRSEHTTHTHTTITHTVITVCGCLESSEAGPSLLLSSDAIRASHWWPGLLDVQTEKVSCCASSSWYVETTKKEKRKTFNLWFITTTRPYLQRSYLSGCLMKYTGAGLTLNNFL